MIQRGLFHRGEARNQRRASRFHQHVVQTFMDHPRVAALQAGEEQRQMRGLHDELRQRIGIGQRGARAAGFQHLIRMRHHGIQPAGHGQRDHPVLRRQHHAAEQHRRDVVAVQAAAGHGLALQRERIQRVARERFIEERIRGDQRGDAGRRRTAQAGAQRNAFLQFDLEPVRQRQRFAQRDQGAAGGVAFGIERQRVGAYDRAADRGDAHFGRVDAADDGDIARTIDGVTEQIEADADVADARGRERAGFVAVPGVPLRSLRWFGVGRKGTHARAPSVRAIARISPNTPAAVTSAPAPGPCTTSGLCA